MLVSMHLAPEKKVSTIVEFPNAFHLFFCDIEQYRAPLLVVFNQFVCSKLSIVVNVVAFNLCNVGKVNLKLQSNKYFMFCESIWSNMFIK